MNFGLMSPMMMLLKVHVEFRGSIFNTGHLIQKSLAPSQASYFTYTHTHRYPNTHIYIQSYAHVYIYTHRYTHIPTYIHTNIHVQT